jgi:hypothetical protein
MNTATKTFYNYEEYLFFKLKRKDLKIIKTEIKGKKIIVYYTYTINLQNPPQDNEA